jgi:hypothetical protein
MHQMTNNVMMIDVFTHMLTTMVGMNNELVMQLRGTFKVFSKMFPLRILVDNQDLFGLKKASAFLKMKRKSFKNKRIGRWAPYSYSVDLSDQSVQHRRYDHKAAESEIKLFNETYKLKNSAEPLPPHGEPTKLNFMELLDQFPARSGNREGTWGHKAGPLSAPPLSLQVPRLMN